jgi:hypothetical protein
MAWCPSSRCRPDKHRPPVRPPREAGILNPLIKTLNIVALLIVPLL